MKNSTGEAQEPIEAEAIVVAPPQPDQMSISRPPQIVLEEAREAARALAEVISSKKRKVMFGGEQYPEFEDWQTVGRFYSTTAREDGSEYVEYGEIHGFKARASALCNGQVIGAAEALCMTDEDNWKNKPLFQLSSMAQTRACAKALRSVLSWVVVLAGYRPTPAEEMADVKPPIQQPTRASERVAEPESAARKISEKQRGLFWAKVHDLEWSDEQAKTLLKRYGVERTDDLLSADFTAVLKELQTGKAGA